MKKKIEETIEEVFHKSQLIDDLSSSTDPFIDEGIEDLKRELIDALTKIVN